MGGDLVRLGGACLGTAASPVHPQPQTAATLWSPNRSKLLKGLARPERFELPTSWFEAKRSIRMSYGRADPSNIARVLAVGSCRLLDLAPSVDAKLGLHLVMADAPQPVVEVGHHAGVVGKDADAVSDPKGVARRYRDHAVLLAQALHPAGPTA